MHIHNVGDAAGTGQWIYTDRCFVDRKYSITSDQWVKHVLSADETTTVMTRCSDSACSVCAGDDTFTLNIDDAGFHRTLVTSWPTAVPASHIMEAWFVSGDDCTSKDNLDFVWIGAITVPAFCEVAWEGNCALVMTDPPDPLSRRMLPYCGNVPVMWDSDPSFIDRDPNGVNLHIVSFLVVIGLGFLFL